MEIISNYHWREVEDGTPTWSGDDSCSYFTYRGERYWLADFTMFGTMWCPEAPEGLADWHAYAGDSFFSGVVVRFGAPDDWEHEEMVQVGTYIA